MTCGDDGPADYGDEAALEFCRSSTSENDLLFFSLAALPLVVLAAGLPLLGRRAPLRWVNRAAVVAIGVGLGTTTAIATAGDLSAVVLGLCAAALAVDGFARLVAWRWRTSSLGSGTQS